MKVTFDIKQLSLIAACTFCESVASIFRIRQPGRFAMKEANEQECPDHVIWRTLRKSVRKWLEKTTLPRFLLAMLLATDMISSRYHDQVSFASCWRCWTTQLLCCCVGWRGLCLTGLVLKSFHSTWDLRSRSWQGMISHFWIAVAMQGCWTLGNTPNHFDITEYESTLEAKLLCCTPWYSISCDASCGTWRVLPLVFPPTFFWHLTWTSGARNE